MSTGTVLIGQLLVTFFGNSFLLLMLLVFLFCYLGPALAEKKVSSTAQAIFLVLSVICYLSIAIAMNLYVWGAAW